MKHVWRVVSVAVPFVLAGYAFAHAEMLPKASFHPDARGKTVLMTVPEDYDTACLDACSAQSGCLGFDTDGAGQCRLYSEIDETAGGPGLEVMIRVDVLGEMAKRRAELAGLHRDLLYRADWMQRYAPVSFDGSFGDVIGPAREQLAAGPTPATLRLLAALARTGDTGQVAALSQSVLDALPKIADGPVKATLVQDLASYAIRGYLTAIDDESRFAAAKVLAYSLEAGGNPAQAALAGELALSVGKSDQLAKALAGWKQAAKAAPAAIAPVKEVGDNAQLTCDNGGACVAQFMTVDGEGLTPAWIEIRKDAGPGTVVRASLFIPTYEEMTGLFENMKPLEPAQLLLDGKLPATHFGDTPLSVVGMSDMLRLDVPADQVDPLLADLAKAKSLDLVSGGKVAATIRLEDAAGFLAKMTAIQTGFAAAAELPKVVVPRQPSAALTETVPTAVLDLAIDNCDVEFDANSQADGKIQGYGLIDSSQLWILECTNGAYNWDGLIVRFKDGEASLVAHEDLDANGKLVTSTDTMTFPNVLFDRNDPLKLEVDFDAESEEEMPSPPTPDMSGLVVSTINRGRGPGDCGTSAVHAFDGAVLRLVSKQTMELCRGNAEFWPSVWRGQLVLTGKP